MERSLKIRDLISLDMLQKVQDNFSEAVGIALITVDERGVPVTRPSGFCDFCQQMRTTERGRDLCFHCDNVGGRTALKKGKPSIYRCHCGLVDFATPILLQNHYLGAIISGQVCIQEDISSHLDYVMAPDDSWQNGHDLTDLHRSVAEISYAKLRSAAYTLFYLAGYLVEESYANAVNQELSAQNLKLAEESRRRVELEKSLREAELQALTYQVNPHFMFNVLNTIGRQAYLENADKTEKIVYAFSDMMRYVLKRSSPRLIKFIDEVEHVNNYLYIQKVRMGDRLSFSMNFAQKYGNVLCPFMTLHPIVENCINYAAEPREETTSIAVDACDDGTDLIVTVTDNGQGIPPDVLHAILSGDEVSGGKSTGIGLHNVDTRLRYFFGDNYGLEVESPVEQGGGTRVRMRFPLDFDPYEM